MFSAKNSLKFTMNSLLRRKIFIFNDLFILHMFELSQKISQQIYFSNFTFVLGKLRTFDFQVEIFPSVYFPVLLNWILRINIGASMEYILRRNIKNERNHSKLLLKTTRFMY